MTKVHNPEKKARVFLVDDHPIVRQGLERLINQEIGLEVCGEADDARTALQKITQSKPDIAIVDLSLGDMSGLDLIKQLKSKHPRLPIVVLSMHDESIYAERALRAGARGYVMKQEGTEKVITAIRKILQGDISVSAGVASKMLSRLAEDSGDSSGGGLDRLSDRELEVFQLIGRGLGTRQIAEKLTLSIKTVESYREHIKQKLKFKNGVELVQQAVRYFQNQENA